MNYEICSDYVPQNHDKTAYLLIYQFQQLPTPIPQQMAAVEDFNQENGGGGEG